MTAALATLVFLSTLWMLVVLGAAVLESHGSKILAALKGHSAEPAIATRPVRLRHRRVLPLRTAGISVRQRAAA